MFNVYYANGEYCKTVYDENEADYLAWAIGGFYDKITQTNKNNIF